MKFDVFVLPFILGLAFVFGSIIYYFSKWINELTSEDTRLLKQHIFSFRILTSVKEIFQESLLHRKVFKKNPLLGYMHMSLAFGWFLLIFVGNIEIKFYSEYSLNPPYVPIFLKFFEPTPAPHFFAKGSRILMDTLLLFVLSGVFLAYFKRFKSKTFGLRNTTKHTVYDKFALTALWFIFPLRLLAESFSSGLHDTGSYLTYNVGHFFSLFLPLENVTYAAWWSYSIALGTFFFALPFSRYMHIPAEVLLIVFRNAGIKAEINISAYSKVEIHSCSRCGICVDPCQLSSSLNNRNIQPAYFLRDVRYNTLDCSTAEDCLMCGKCNVACPVGINSTNIRQAKRIDLKNNDSFSYDYIKPFKPETCEVIYFAGCMTHLTPGISRSIGKIFNTAGINWQFLDKDGSICCGRPLKLAGQLDAANDLMAKNKELILNSKAKILVTSCPICFHAFKSENLNIKVLHHTQYLLQLLEDEKIIINKSHLSAVYHDPCELGRHNEVYLEPRLLVNHAATIIPLALPGMQAPCCGGSLGNHLLSDDSKTKLSEDALKVLDIENADQLITSCPLCKKTFSKSCNKPVLDVAELIAAQLVTEKPEPTISARKPLHNIVVNN